MNPPRPRSPRKPDDIRTRYKIFYGESAPGFIKGGTTVAGEMIQNAHAKAEAWISDNPEMEIVSISNGSGNDGSAYGIIFVSVWYRKP